MSEVNLNKKVTLNEYLLAKQHFFEGKPDECWPWYGSFTKGGIPRIKIDQISYKAHRITLLYSLGLQISALKALHKPFICKNKPNCVNPAHLYLGTDADNTYDCVKEGIHDCLNRQGSNHAMTKFTNQDVYNIRRRGDAGERHKDLAIEYNVNPVTITQIVNRKNFRYLDEE